MFLAVESNHDLLTSICYFVHVISVSLYLSRKPYLGGREEKVGPGSLAPGCGGPRWEGVRYKGVGVGSGWGGGIPVIEDESSFELFKFRALGAK